MTYKKSKTEKMILKKKMIPIYISRNDIEFVLFHHSSVFVHSFLNHIFRPQTEKCSYKFCRRKSTNVVNVFDFALRCKNVLLCHTFYCVYLNEKICTKLLYENFCVSVCV